MTKYVSKFNILGETPIYVKDSEARQLITNEAALREAGDTANATAITAEAETRAGEVQALQLTDSDLQRQINEIVIPDTVSPVNYGYVGMCHLNDEDMTALLYTTDFKSLHVVKKYPLFSDAATPFKVGDWWYASYGRAYKKSKDLISWSDGISRPESPYGYKIWGGHFRKMKDGSYIWTATYQYRPDSDTFTTGIGNASYYFEIRWCYCTFDNSTGEVSFGSTQKLTIPSQSDSIIDCDFVYHEQSGFYYGTYKDEHTSTVHFMRGANINVFAEISSNPTIGMEAVWMVPASNGDIVATGDFYLTGLWRNLGIWYPAVQRPMYGWLVRSGTQRNVAFINSATSGNFRHCTWQPMTADMYNDVMALGCNPSATSLGTMPFESDIIYIYQKSNGNTVFDINPETSLSLINIYENIPTLTLNIVRDGMAGGRDITVNTQNACSVTISGNVYGGNKTFALAPGEIIVLKYLHNQYYPYKPA